MSDYKLTREDCVKIVRQDLGSNNFEIIKYEEKNLSNEVLGIMGGHFKQYITIKVNGEIIEKTYFKKQMCCGFEIQNEMIRHQGAFKKEKFMYDFLTKVNQVEPKFVPNFVPKCYFTVENELFILEELGEDGYVANKDGTYYLNYEDLKFCLNTLAKFHSATIIYESKNNKITEFLEYLQEPLYRNDENYLGDKLFKASVSGALALIDIMPQFSENKAEIKQKFIKYSNQVYDLVKTSPKYLNVICHGDLWASNILVKYSNDAPINCKLIDFQHVRYNTPALDLLMLIYGGLFEQVQKNKNDLYQHYYRSLKTNLQEFNINIEDLMTFKQFEESIEHILPFIIIQKICFQQMCAIECIQELKTNQNMFKTFMYEDRIDACVNLYKNNPFFKMMMDNGMKHLVELL